jgi:O-acetylhomoserine (thiol)-lyase
MHHETIAVHSGYEIEPSMKAVAVPIYQTVAYAFDSSEHGAALFNLEVEGHRMAGSAICRCCARTARLCPRKRAGSAVRQHGAAALHYAVLNLTQPRYEYRLRSTALWDHSHPVCSPVAEPRGNSSICRNR